MSIGKETIHDSPAISWVYSIFMHFKMRKSVHGLKQTNCELLKRRALSLGLLETCAIFWWATLRQDIFAAGFSNYVFRQTGVSRADKALAVKHPLGLTNLVGGLMLVAKIAQPLFHTPQLFILLFLIGVAVRGKVAKWTLSGAIYKRKTIKPIPAKLVSSIC